jgi:cytochrome oxidase Cu insertion factor (SCO1/SenC/PrrC family)
MVYTLERVNAQPGEDFIAITVSFDPGEGAELARQKKKNYLDSIERPFPSDAWRWLTADKETIEKLTTAVGFEYKKEGVEFRHAANLIYGLFKGKKVGANPWEGITLEWTIPSPPPLENFEKIPHVTRGPYDYKVEESK